MGTKANPNPAYDCYANAEPDEPMFVLLARDPRAAVLVNLWAAMSRMDEEDPTKIAEAEKTANEMVMWMLAKRPGREPIGVAGAACALAVLAEMSGAVVHIWQQALEPLAMGNYTHMVDVRPTAAARAANEEAVKALEGVVAAQ